MMSVEGKTGDELIPVSGLDGDVAHSEDVPSSSEEFFDAVSDDDKGNEIVDPVVVETLSVLKPVNQMADSGVFSMHSSRTDNEHISPLSELNEVKLEEAICDINTLTSTALIESSGIKSTLTANAKESSDKNEDSSREPNDSCARHSDAIPRPPPRTRKKKLTKKCELNNETNGNHSSSADSHSMTNSVESTTPSLSHSNVGQNITSILDDIQSIKGDLNLNEVDDKRSVYLDEHLHNLNQNFKYFKQKFFPSERRERERDHLKELQKDISSQTKCENIEKPTLCQATEFTTPDQKKVVPTSEANENNLNTSDSLSPCLNPLSLHLMKLTNEFDENNPKANSLEKESSSIADTTFKSVTSLISSTLSDIKNDKKNKSLDKKSKKKLKETEEANEEEFNNQVESIDADDDDDDDDKNSVDFKDGKLKSKIRDLKRLGSGLIRGVRGVKSTSGKERSTFHVDLKSYSGEPEPPPPIPRFKLKVNHKRGGADFDNLKLLQEINDCKGAIWCMKFSNCSQLLAAAGQDHLLRVYCSQKAWKYFTNLRNKASGQHISPNSTKERGSSNGDSLGRVHRSSYSRSGSLNANDSHNNSSSSSSSSAFAKELYREEDNTLSEEGPLLLFTIYRGHTADVLDLAWSKNHFLLSSSMDKTVRLWHITRIECLCTFRHIDFVTTIQFHPRDDRYFLSGSLDGKLRLWNIPDKRVTLWNEVNSLASQRGGGNGGNPGETDMSTNHGLITASSFVQNGKFAVIGTYDGRIIFYTTDQLKYFTQIHVSLKNSNNPSTQSGTSLRTNRTNKVTGIESVDANNKILVTTNDSRLRLYDLRDLSLTCKYKGCINQSSQIKAAISHDHKYIICGSENNSFYIWRIQDNSTIGQRRDRNKQYECIRLLNPPPTQALPVTTPIFSNESVGTSSASSSSTNVTKIGQGDKQLVLDKESRSTSIPSESVLGSKESGGGPSVPITSQTTQPPPPPPTSYSSAATKIVTSAIFAPVPGQIDEKARYVIAISDFNGFIRVFSKY